MRQFGNTTNLQIITITQRTTMSNKENLPTFNKQPTRTTTAKTTTPLQLPANPTEQHLQKMLIDIHQSRDTAHNKYQTVISSLEGLIQELLKRNDFLVKDRETLLREQIELKKENEALNSVMQVKQRLGDSGVVEANDIFEILEVENNSASRGQSKISQSCEFAPGRFTEQNSYIFQRQELVISSVPLSYNISQNISQNISRINENQISMSNIGQIQTVNHTQLNTPSLKTDNIFVRCSTLKPEGIIRAFYLAVIQRKDTAKILSSLIDSLKNDIISIIYEVYPTNQFWTDMLCNFLKFVHEGHFDTQVELLQYLKIHRLIDTLMIRCLKSRIQFLFDGMGSDQKPSVRQILTALSNEFGMKMEAYEGQQYMFYLKEEKDFNLLQSHHASLNASMIQKDSQSDEPYFIIYEREEYLQFPFFIYIEQEQPGLSHFQMKEVLDFQEKLHSFRCSEENDKSMVWKDRTSQDISGNYSNNNSILRERDLNSFEEQKRLKRVHPFKQYNARKDLLLCQPLNSSRFFLNRVSSKRSDFDERA